MVRFWVCMSFVNSFQVEAAFFMWLRSYSAPPEKSGSLIFPAPFSRKTTCYCKDAISVPNRRGKYREIGAKIACVRL